MLKLLQIATVVMFIALAIGAILFIAIAPEKWPQYREFITTFWPLFVAEVIPAFLGKPLTEGVRNLTQKGGSSTLPGVPQ